MNSSSMNMNSINPNPAANSMTKKLSTKELSMMFTFGCDCCHGEISCRRNETTTSTTNKPARGGAADIDIPQDQDDLTNMNMHDGIKMTKRQSTSSADNNRGGLGLGTKTVSWHTLATFATNETTKSGDGSDSCSEEDDDDAERNDVRGGVVVTPSFASLLEDELPTSTLKSHQSQFPGSVSFHRHRAEMASEVIVERGILSPTSLEARARDIIPTKCHNSNLFVVTDTIVDKYLGDQVVSSFARAGFTVFKIIVPAEQEDVSGESSGERFKTLGTLGDVCDEIIGTGLDKFSCIVSLGGGVVNNMCGMVASMIYRGITLVHFPTTTMAQADAAIDFKQAVNHPLGKNLLGTYYPATTIVCDPNVLTTLSARHILNGLSECIKHGICHDMDLLKLVLKCSNEKDLLDPAFLEQVVRNTVALKAETLTDYDASDFNEMAPQYGHAVGHAVEHLSWKKACAAQEDGGDGEGEGESKMLAPLLHGEACAIGMCVSAEISHLMGFCDRNTVEEHYRIFQTAHLPSIVPAGLELEEILHKMTYDKHFVVKPSMGLVRDIAVMQTNEVGGYTFMIEPDIMEEALTRNMARRFAPALPVSVAFHRYRAEMAYEVLVERGILSCDKLAIRARDIIPVKCHNSNLFVVTDTIVDKYLGNQVMAAFEEAEFSVFKIVVPAEQEYVSGESSGERFKTLGTLGDVCDEIIGTGLDKFSCIVSLGGGVVNNMCGMVAIMIYRGIALVHFPTTMMTQADAVIDFKQAVNHPQGKNLLGTNYPAATIVCDPNVLTTLSPRHILNGLSECIKHGICHDMDLITELVLKCSNEKDLLDPAFLEQAVRKTVTLRAITLTDYDGSDFNVMAPQYGHAVEHAVEHLSWKKAYCDDCNDGASVAPCLLHGEACAIGMCVLAEISFLVGFCDQDGGRTLPYLRDGSFAVGGSGGLGIG
jgi:3-dehydroquinate synthase